MRAVLTLLLALHGLAHLVGFVAPWGLLPASPAGAPPSQPTNVLLGGRVLGAGAARWLSVVWLALAVAFVVLAAGVWRQSYSIRALIAVTAVSLVLCVAWWPAARMGAYLNLAIGALIAAMVVSAFRRDIGDAHARVRGAAMAQTIRGQVEYATRGSGHPVLSIHGTGGGWDQGLDAARDMLPDGFRIIAPSRYGYLGTPMIASPTPEAEADLFAALLDELDVDRVTVISYSAGTAPALQFALRYPQRTAALVLVVPAAGGILPPQTGGPPAFVTNVVLKYDFPMWLAMRVVPGTMHKLVGMAPDLVATLPRSEAEHVTATIRSLLPVSKRAKGMMYDARLQAGALSVYPLSDIQAPTLLISAEDDLYRTLRVARHARGLIPDARVLAFPTGGHLLAGRTPEIRSALGEFLQSRVAALEGTGTNP